MLDNFEVNLDEITRKIMDPEIAGFYIHMISNLAGESRAIVTSRYMPADMLVLPSIVKEKPLGDFPESSFMKFMLLDGIVEQRYYKNEISYALLSRLYELLGGTPRFLGQIREVLKTIRAEELDSELEAVKLPSKEKPALLQQARDKYCEDIFTSRLYGYLKQDAQKALCRVAVYGIPVNMSGMKAVTGEPVEKLQRFTREWQDYALAYPEPAAGGLWIVYGLLRSWLFAPERLSPDERRAAHKAAGGFLYELVKNDRTSELGMNPLDAALEAYSQYISAEDYENAASIVFELQEYLDRWGNYRTLVELYTLMLPQNHFSNEILLSKETHGVVMGNLGNAYGALGQVEKAIQYYEKALAIAQEIGDRRGEGTWLNNLGFAFQNEKKYREALACYLLAKEIRMEINDSNIKTTESNISNIKEELGENKFEKLIKEVESEAEEIVKKILK